MCKDRVRKVKAKLELILTRAQRTTGKASTDVLTRKRKVREGLHPGNGC